MSSLAETLREGTEAAHRRVERLPFVQTLLAGRLETARYCLLLRSLHTIYAALERGLAQHGPAAWALPALRRRAALEADLRSLHGPRWADELPVQPAAAAYAAHLDTLSANPPQGLVAHAYVRYLGDLSGGQLVRRAVARALARGGTEGLHFYDFEPPAAELARTLRTVLAGADGDDEAARTLVAEAVSAFERHERLFEELERTRGACTVAS